MAMASWFKGFLGGWGRKTLTVGGESSSSSRRVLPTPASESKLPYAGPLPKLVTDTPGLVKPSGILSEVYQAIGTSAVQPSAAPSTSPFAATSLGETALSPGERLRQKVAASRNRPLRPISISLVDTDTKPVWLRSLPGRILFFDVETTGLHSTDRIVSFAGILLETEALARKSLKMNVVEVVCDPGRKSHPRAEEVHGFDDWTLRHQEPFGTSIDKVTKFFEEADLVVSHNIEFDLSFVNREFLALGRSPVSGPSHCTMRAHRQSGLGGSSSLGAVAARIGHLRQQQRHGALEDAYLAMMVYLNAGGVPYSFPQFTATLGSDPTMAVTLNPVPPRPDGPLPRRKRRNVPPLAGTRS